MNTRTWIAACLTLCSAVAAHAQPAPTAMDQAEFVFVGEVTSVSAPQALARAKAGTVSVRVDRVLKPEGRAPLASYKGQTVALRLKQANTLDAGTTATFYTRVGSLGKVLELIELSHTAAPDVASQTQQVEMAARTGERALATQRQVELERQVSAANVVLSGRVLSIRESAAAGPTGRLSEHDPEWREAVVEVMETVKGEVATDQVTLRFPGSKDVAWYHAPKLQEGQKGIFFLGPDGAVLSQPVAAVGATAPVISSPDSVLPATNTNLQAIRAAAQKTRK